MLYYSIYNSPVGQVFLASSDKGICKISLEIEDPGEFFSYIAKIGYYSEDTGRNQGYLNQIDQYFKGTLKEFDVPMDLKGTEFQLSVWKEISKIPYGMVGTYGDVAKALTTSPRAVGQANKKNPIPIIIPCHRVVSRTGIGGYGGQAEGDNIKIKTYLLDMEGFDLSKFSHSAAF